MSTITMTPSTTARPGRVLSTFKLHFANPAVTVWTPLLVVGAIFGVNVLIWVIMHLAASPSDLADMRSGTSWSGASLWAFVYMLIMATQAMNATFQFALGVGVTRRDYFLGTVLAFVALSAAWAIVFAALAAVEVATNGWGLDGSLFAAIYFGDDGPFARLGYMFSLMLFFSFLGTSTGALYLRWKQYGIIGFIIGLAVIVLGGLLLIGLTQSWRQVGEFFATIGFAGGYSLLLVPTAIAGLVGYLFIRRATPRSA